LKVCQEGWTFGCWRGPWIISEDHGGRVCNTRGKKVTHTPRMARASIWAALKSRVCHAQRSDPCLYGTLTAPSPNAWHARTRSCLARAVATHAQLPATHARARSPHAPGPHQPPLVHMSLAPGARSHARPVFGHARARAGFVYQGRINCCLNVSRALGDAQFKQDAFRPACEQQVSPEPDIREALVNTTSDFLVRGNPCVCVSCVRARACACVRAYVFWHRCVGR